LHSAKPGAFEGRAYTRAPAMLEVARAATGQGH